VYPPPKRLNNYKKKNTPVPQQRQSLKKMYSAQMITPNATEYRTIIVVWAYFVRLIIS